MTDTTQSGRRTYFRRYYANRTALRNAQKTALPDGYVDVSPLSRGRPKRRGCSLRIEYFDEPINPFASRTPLAVSACASVVLEDVPEHSDLASPPLGEVEILASV